MFTEPFCFVALCCFGPANFLVQAQQFHFKHQGGVGGDHAAGTTGAVAQLGGDGQLALAADLHALHALVPASDDPALA